MSLFSNILNTVTSTASKVGSAVGGAVSSILRTPTQNQTASSIPSYNTYQTTQGSGMFGESTVPMLGQVAHAQQPSNMLSSIQNNPVTSLHTTGQLRPATLPTTYQLTNFNQPMQSSIPGSPMVTPAPQAPAGYQAPAGSTPSQPMQGPAPAGFQWSGSRLTPTAQALSGQAGSSTQQFNPQQFSQLSPQFGVQGQFGAFQSPSLSGQAGFGGGMSNHLGVIGTGGSGIGAQVTSPEEEENVRAKTPQTSQQFSMGFPNPLLQNFPTPGQGSANTTPMTNIPPVDQNAQINQNAQRFQNVTAGALQQITDLKTRGVEDFSPSEVATDLTDGLDSRTFDNRINESVQKRVQELNSINPIPPQTLVDTQEQTDFLSQFPPQEQYDIRAMMDQIKLNNGYDGAIQRRAEAQNLLASITETYTKVIDDIKANPDLPKALAQRRIDEVMGKFKFSQMQAMAMLEQAQTELDSIDALIAQEFQIANFEEQRANRAMDNNRQMLSLMINSGSIAGMSDSDIQQWSQATGFPVGALQEVRRATIEGNETARMKALQSLEQSTTSSSASSQFTKTQIAKGALNAGVSIEEFSQFDVDTANAFINNNVVTQEAYLKNYTQNELLTFATDDKTGLTEDALKQLATQLGVRKLLKSWSSERRELIEKYPQQIIQLYFQQAGIPSWN